MNVTYYSARTPSFTPEYIAYRDRVVNAGGSIASQTSCQRALDFLAANQAAYQFDQWLDARFGVQAGSVWFSILGAGTEVGGTASRAPLLGTDVVLNTPVWAGGTFDGGLTPLLAPADSYTIGMRYLQASPGAPGFFFGNRYGGLDQTSFGSWWYVQNGFLQYRFYDAFEGYPTFPLDTWSWLWLVLDGAAGTATIYDETNTVLFQHPRVDYWGRIPFGIGGGTDSNGINDNHFRYQQVLRCRAALTAAQRADFQAI